jgi:hypothetical protein
MSDDTTTPPAAPGFADRVAAQALDVRMVPMILSLLAFPFYLIGVIAAVVWLAVRWCYAAVKVGFADVKNRGAGAG